jgi:D-beta-D-heptose 7-phosphate kinase/D-beta-D-heptose 1-phosphate adenosyltransferase
MYDNYKLKNKKILLLGDFFLDEFLIGDCERISPESPVPIIKPINSIFSLGGSGNVLSNISNLGINIIPLGILGTDFVSKKIFKFLRNKNISLKNFIVDNKYSGILKKRIVVKNQHIARIDYENLNFQLSVKYEKKIKAKILELIKKCDLVVISDYGKGNLNNNIINFSIKTANKLKIPSIIDPRKKNNDFSIYSGASFITPNLEELRNIFPNLLNNDLEIIKASKIIKTKNKIKNILVTRGEKGITLLNDKLKFHSTSVAKDVFDVSGAGDTIVAVLSAGILLKMDIKKIVKLANLCAGYVISLRGTVPITLAKFKEYQKLL